MYQQELRNPNGLTNEEIAAVAPSITALVPYQGVSEQYLPIPTIQLLDGLRGEGFVPVQVMQAKSKNAERKNFTKHLVRLRQDRYLGNAAPEVPEIILINSHDGGSSYQLMSGYFRMVCSNGMITGDKAATMRVTHRRYHIIEEVIEATYKIAAEAEGLLTVIREMKRIHLSKEEQLLLAREAVALRFGEAALPVPGTIVEGTVTYPPESLLRRRRYDDKGDDLHTVTNVIQENALSGGARGRDDHGFVKRSRAVKGIDQTVQFNQRLWVFAQELRKFKVEQAGSEVVESTLEAVAV